jgi:hypothetical protein
MARNQVGLASVLFPTVLALHCPAQLKGRVWTHDGLGVRLTIPEGYTLVPLQVDEKWIVAKFLCDKTYISKSRDYNWEHRPLLRVIAFTEEAKKSGGVEVEEEGDTTFIGIGAVPYQGYRDYVKRHRSGFFFSREEDAEVAGEKCLMCEVQVHKSDPKLRLLSTVFRRQKLELAVEFEVLEDRVDKLENSCRDTLASVRFLEPAGAVATAAAGDQHLTSRLWTGFRTEWRKRAAKDRFELRIAIEKARHDKVRATTPADWKLSDSKKFLVVSHADTRFTERMTEGAELFRAWCEQEFDDLSDDYVRRGVLRLCRDFDEYKAYHFDSSGTTGWSLFGDDHEVGTYRDGYHGTSGTDVALLFPGILRSYLQEKDPFIVSYTPTWLTWALDDYVSAAIVKSRKLEFRVDDYVRDDSRDLLREGKLPKLREILEMDEDAFIARLKTEYRVGYATTQALRYVLGPGQKEKVFKDFVKSYFRAAAAAAERHEDDWKQAETRVAETEEEEEQQAKERASRSKERRKQLQKEINDALFGKIDARQWERLEKGYEAFVKAGK